MAQSRIRIVPLELADANAFVAAYHRHHQPVVGHRFSLGAIADGKLVGAVIVGRPVARLINQRTVLEVTRLVADGTPNACSALYGAAARAGKAMGYERIHTYILDSETGVSLRAAGWRSDGFTNGDTWDRPNRSRPDIQPLNVKQKWSKRLNEAPPEYEVPIYETDEYQEKMAI